MQNCLKHKITQPLQHSIPYCTLPNIFFFRNIIFCFKHQKNKDILCNKILRSQCNELRDIRETLLLICTDSIRESVQIKLVMCHKDIVHPNCNCYHQFSSLLCIRHVHSLSFSSVLLNSCTVTKDLQGSESFILRHLSV